MTYRSFLWVTTLLTTWALFPNAGRTDEKASLPGDNVFGTDKVLQFQLTLSEKSFAALKPANKPGFGPPGFGAGFGPPAAPTEGTHRNTFGIEFPWSQCDLTYNDTTYQDVGLRYKGNYTFMATSRSLKKSFKIDLNRHVDEQRLDGLTMMNLHCGVSDPSLSRESLSLAFFRAAGVPAPRSAFVKLNLTVPGQYDQEFVGVYTLVEQVNKPFLKRHFQDGGGMLLKPEGLQGGPTYLGENWQPYEDRLRPEKKPTAAQKQRLIEFTKLISESSDEVFASQIGTYLDLEAFLKFIAANALLSNLDSYLGFGHNYYLYLDPVTNQFLFIPWDLDLSLATWPAVGTPEQLVELSLEHPHAGQNKLIDRLFAIQEHRSRYQAILKDLTTTSFDSQSLLASLQQIETALKEPLALEGKAVAARREGQAGNGFGAGFGNGQFGQSMPPRLFIEKRTESVAAQLSGKSKGFVPKPFGVGFGAGFGGPPGAKPGAKPGGPKPGIPQPKTPQPQNPQPSDPKSESSKGGKVESKVD